MLAPVATLFPGPLNAVIARTGPVQNDVSAPPPPSPSICGSAASVSTSVSTSTFVSASASIAAAPTAAPLADSQPLVVQLRRGAERLRVLSYSGRRVCLDLDGSRVCFDVLATADGGVLLAGTDFLWSPAHPVRVAGYEIRARSLTTTTISASLL
jgi:hypothetical protein